MATRASDPYVQNTQKWLNDTFGGKNGYTIIEENGKTGWTTIYALIHALQITLEVGSTADNFGTGTANAFNSFVSANGNIKERTTAQDAELIQRYENATGAEKESLGKLIDQYQKIHGIIQGALLCKGYAIGANTPTGNFYSGTANAIKNLKEDAGLSDTTSIVTLNIMKALLSMDYFYSYDTSAKTLNIQNIQRYLNANYENYIGLTPCDGVYGRGTNKALIYAIQAEEGMSTSVANGNFGPSTKRCCPTIPYNGVETNYAGNVYSEQKIARFIKLLNMALYVNGVGSGNFNNTIDVGAIKQFQNKYALPITGICNLTTWLSVFISSGDTERSAIACDCATILTVAKAKTLYDNGYRYVGRYLSGNIVGGASKALSREELQIAFNEGLRIFPIQQASANAVSYFTEAQAELDVDSAYSYATNLGIPEGTIIYFAVDCDPQDYQITSNIIPYFKKVYETMRDSKNSKYRIGIYGTRNVCTRVSELGYAVTSFVCDMSTGFSGNLGFTIPNNWAFDQFATIAVGTGDGRIEIDKDGFSGRDTGIGEIDVEYESDPDYSIPIGYDTTTPQPAIMVNTSNKSFNVYSSKAEDVCFSGIAREEIDAVTADLGYTLINPANSNLWGVAGRKVGEIKPGDLFVRFECRDNSLAGIPEYADQVMNYGDSVHKVLFRTNDGTVRYGYIQEALTPDEYNMVDSRRYGRENFIFYNFDPVQNKLVVGNNQFIVKRPLKYVRADNKQQIGILSEGTILKTGGNAGASMHDHMWFRYIVKADGSLEDLDTARGTGAFVDLDMKNGVNGYDRPLW